MVDGASTDNSVEVLRSAPAIQWISEPDEGQADALAKGFALAEGSILTWLNADDELHQNAVTTVVRAFGVGDPIDWVYGRGVIRGPGLHLSVEPVSPIDDRALRFGNPFTQPATFFRNDLLKDVGGIDPSFHLSMDLDLWLRFIRSGAARRFIPENIARMNFGASSKTAKIPRQNFLRENFRAYLKSGWEDAAYIALGEIAAYDAMSDGRVDREALTASRAQAALWAGSYLDQVDTVRLAAAARVAAGFAEQHLSGRVRIASLRHFLHPVAWRTTEARARTGHGLTRKLVDRARARRLPAHFG